MKNTPPMVLNSSEFTFVHILRFSVFSCSKSIQCVYYFLLLLSNGSICKMLRTMLAFYTACISLFHAHTSAQHLLFVMSLWISLIVKYDAINFIPLNIVSVVEFIIFNTLFSKTFNCGIAGFSCG